MPRRERHILSIVSSVVSCTVLIVALALKEWATSDANDCNFVFALTSVIKSPTNGMDTTFGCKSCGGDVGGVYLLSPIYFL